MKRRRLSLDTLHVARLPLSMLIEPAVRPRPKGDFVDANASGGKLLTYKEMEAAVKMKVAAAEAKKQAKQEASAARAARKAKMVPTRGIPTVVKLRGLLLGPTAFHDIMVKRDRIEENDQDAPEIQEHKV
ncbi:hypothetical protein KRP22_009564 [Phytophthora ramorum]|nr:hypothetical protein KRP22_8397 [Phytophthora ramorum]